MYTNRTENLVWRNSGIAFLAVGMSFLL